MEKLYIIEELEPIFETQIKAQGIECVGKEIFSIQGELSVALIKNKLLGEPIQEADKTLPVRPPVMCPGCPHRSVFYVLHKLKLMVTADIGCYTLGAGQPLNAVDTVVCMGASIGMCHGVDKLFHSCHIISIHNLHAVNSTSSYKLLQIQLMSNLVSYCSASCRVWLMSS